MKGFHYWVLFITWVFLWVGSKQDHKNSCDDRASRHGQNGHWPTSLTQWVSNWAYFVHPALLCWSSPWLLGGGKRRHMELTHFHPPEKYFPAAASKFFPIHPSNLPNAQGNALLDPEKDQLQPHSSWHIHLQIAGIVVQTINSHHKCRRQQTSAWLSGCLQIT